MQSLVECLVKQKVEFFLLAIGPHLVLLTQLWQQNVLSCSLDPLCTTYCADFARLQLQAIVWHLLRRAMLVTNLHVPMNKLVSVVSVTLAACFVAAASI